MGAASTPVSSATSASWRLVARATIADEARALSALAEQLNDRQMGEIVDAIVGRCDQIIVSGIGKSGVIAQKIAATLTSTGTPASFLHPVEALHGDLGVVTQRCALLALSRSGNTEEFVRFVAHFRRLGGPVIGVTQGRESRLAELSDWTIALPDLPEAGPLGLAPTTSCIMQLAAGDALAMALLARRGFTAEDFATYHPEGPLGRRLLLRAADLMHGGEEMPLVGAGASWSELLLEMTKKKLGMALITQADGTLMGTFTDGDLRRLLERVDNPKLLSASEAHAKSRRSPDAPAVPISTVEPSKPAVDCLRLMRDMQITALVVCEADRRPRGILRLIDLVRAGIG